MELGDLVVLAVEARRCLHTCRCANLDQRDMLQYVQLHLQGKLSYLSLGHEPQAQGPRDLQPVWKWGYGRCHRSRLDDR